MLPILIKLGPISIRTYGLFVAIGLFFALRYLVVKTKKTGIKESQILDLGLYTIVSGLIGGRILYVILNWSFYARHFADIFKIWEGGLVFYGGFITGIIAIIIYMKQHPSIKLVPFLDILAPAVALAHFFGRIGCFFAGCCYGLPAKVFWSVQFKNPECLAPINVPLHPTQIYEAIGNLVIFFFLNWYNKFKHAKGNSVAAFIFLYGILRFNVEILRGDDRGLFVWLFSVSQLFSIILMIAGILYLWLKRNDPPSQNMS